MKVFPAVFKSIHTIPMCSKNNVKRNSKPFYRYIKGKTKSRTQVGPLKDEDGRVLTDEKDMTDNLNECFCTVPVFTEEDPTSIPEPVKREVRSN